jgi:hypothetical protein
MPYSVDQIAAALGLSSQQVRYHLGKAQLGEIHRVSGHPVLTKAQFDALKKHVEEHSYLLRFQTKQLAGASA